MFSAPHLLTGGSLDQPFIAVVIPDQEIKFDSYTKIMWLELVYYSGIHV